MKRFLVFWKRRANDAGCFFTGRVIIEAENEAEVVENFIFAMDHVHFTIVELVKDPVCYGSEK